MPVISPGDYEPSPAPNSCAGCGARISDRYYLQAVDRQWHVTCLTCCQCKIQLDSEKTCFAKDGHIYCKEDYYRMFAVKRCARCQKGIFANELVMRARDLVFHLHCFTCAWCNSALTQGDYFGLRDELVYCRTHYELIIRGETVFAPTPATTYSGDDSMGYPPTLIPHLSPMIPSESVEQPTTIEHSVPSDRPPLGDGNSFSTFPSVVSGRKGRPRKRKNVELRVEGFSPTGIGLSPIEAAACNLHLSQLDTSSGVSQHHHQQQVSPPLTGNNGQSGQRTKRMRTSFKHHQLRTMKSYFNINQNPDAKDLKQLAQKTGLSKRVLQVWFQNARAKWRRNNLKQQDAHLITGDQGTGGPHLHGGPHGALSGMNSPGATSSFSESSPVPSCGGIPSDGPLSSSQTSGNPSLDFDGSNPMNPLLSSHHAMSGVHNGDTPIHITSFHEMF